MRDSVRSTLCLRRLVVACLAVTVCAGAQAELRAERLPIKAYTTADGLGHNVVNRIVRDSRGFMWFATNDGLSRFDGYGFTNYTVEQGLPHRRVMDFLEAANGEFWVATYGGLVRFTPAAAASPATVLANDAKTPPPMFTVVLPDGSDPDSRIVTTLRQTRDGTIWCGTRRGLFRLDRSAGRLSLRAFDLGIRSENVFADDVTSVLEDRSGSLWIGTFLGLYRRRADGSVSRHDPVPHIYGTHVQHLFEDRDRRLWVSTRYTGLLVLDISSGHDPVIRERYDAPKDLLTSWVYETRHASDGRIWLATNYGLAELIRESASGAVRFRMYTRRHGLTHHAPNTMSEDGAGNLWLATEIAGAMRLARNGFTTWSTEDGVVAGVKFVEDRKGDLYTIASVPLPRGGDTPILRFGRVTDAGFEWFIPPAPFFFGWGVAAIQTQHGEWWIAGSETVVRYASKPGLIETRTAKPAHVYGTKDRQAMHLLEDSQGGIWVALWGSAWGLSRWDPTGDQWRDLVGAAGLPTLHSEAPRVFARDAAGNVWIGFNTGVARYRDQRFDFYGAGKSFAAGRIVAIHAGDDRRVWLGSSEGGLIRVDDAASAQPRFTTFTTAQGLSSNVVEAVTLDRDGLVYASTSRGIDQFDPATGHVRNLSVENDLKIGAVTHAYLDRKGSLWFATNSGIAKYTPEPSSRSTPPSIYLTGLRVAGQERHVSALGEAEVALADLSSNANQLEIQFVAIGSGPSSTLRYQYRLEGADQNWSGLTTQRSVTYASFAPGTYRFLVRAMTTDGVASSTPAVVSFRVLPPFWRTWWFLSVLVVAAGATAYAFHRHRIAHVVELGRIRTRIATDLHDDLGANLTRIAILSEVAKKHVAADHGDGAEKLSAIATIARESVSSMGDIVWAISPERDALEEVVRKMRHCAEDAFEGRDVDVTFDVPDPSQGTSLDISVRRDVYLIFKEAINNAARHSRSTSVTVLFRASRQELRLEVADNGIGFDATAGSEGTGVGSMRRRAERLGATLEIISRPRSGTRLTLTMPGSSSPPAREPGR